jgi:hypothetical protein
MPSGFRLANRLAGTCACPTPIPRHHCIEPPAENCTRERKFSMNQWWSPVAGCNILRATGSDASSHMRSLHGNSSGQGRTWQAGRWPRGRQCQYQYNNAMASPHLSKLQSNPTPVAQTRSISERGSATRRHARRKLSHLSCVRSVSREHACRFCTTSSTACTGLWY